MSAMSSQTFVCRFSSTGVGRVDNHGERLYVCLTIKLFLKKNLVVMQKSNMKMLKLLQTFITKGLINLCDNKCD